MLIIVSYTVNDSLVHAYENGSTGAAVGLISFTAILALGSLVFLILQYVWFHACAGPLVIVSYTLLFGIIWFILVFLRSRKDASIFTSSMVFAYVTFLSWSAIASLSDTECNPFAYDTSNLITQIALGAFFTFVSLIGVSVINAGTTSSESDKKIGEGVKSVVSEDPEDSKASNLESVELRNG